MGGVKINSAIQSVIPDKINVPPKFYVIRLPPPPPHNPLDKLTMDWWNDDFYVQS